MASKILKAAYDFSGWNVWEFIKGRKKLVVTIIGGLAGWIATADPTLAAVSAAATELVFAIIEYFIKEQLRD